MVNRLLLPLINQAARLVDSGIADVQGVDTAMRLGALHPVGPLQVADLIGLDVCVAILERLLEKTSDLGLTPAKAITERVAAGKLGRKTGEGFYKY